MRLCGVKDALGLLILRLEGGADFVKGSKGHRPLGVEGCFEHGTVFDITVFHVHIEDDYLLLWYLGDSLRKGGLPPIDRTPRHPPEVGHGETQAKTRPGWSLPSVLREESEY